MRARRRPLLGAGLGLAGAGLLLLHTGRVRAETDFTDMLAYRRLWSDWTLGVVYYLDATRPMAEAKEASRPWPEWSETIQAYREILIAKVVQDRLSPLRFWRTTRIEPFVRNRGRPGADAADDPGRALLLGWGFRMVGGPAPFLILWLGTLIAAPVLVWTAVELSILGRATAAAVFLGLVVSSLFVVEVLSLARSAVAFHLVSLLLVVPIAAWAVLSPGPTARGLVGRAAAAGLVFGLCALCRSSALFMLPAFLLAIGVAAWRSARRSRAAAATGAVALAVFLAPYAALRQPQHHDVWAAVWEGLGDFDRTKGHAWSDDVAEQVVRAAGGDARTSATGQAILRDLVLRDVREDPVWYVGILARRAMAVVSQSKLWPRASTDGLWMARGRSFNEGFLDKYYTYTTTADFLGWGERRVELPVGLMVAPGVLVLAFALGGSRDRAPTLAAAALGEAAAWARPALPVLAAVALAALPAPVLVTTAGAVEPQAFVVVYLLAAAFAAEAFGRAVLLLVRSRHAGQPAVATTARG